MTDFYKKLGVSPNATTEAIRRAYRKKAKKAHPDTGGSEEEFASLKLAHDILTDPARRQKYDETGDISEKSPDNDLREVIQILAQSLENILTQIDHHNGEPTQYALVSDMKILIGSKIDEVKRNISNLENSKRKAEKLLGRFGCKEGQNYLEGIIVGKISALDTNMRIARTKLEPFEKALDILNKSTFRSDAEGVDNRFNYGVSSYRLADLMAMAGV